MPLARLRHHIPRRVRPEPVRHRPRRRERRPLIVGRLRARHRPHPFEERVADHHLTDLPAERHLRIDRRVLEDLRVAVGPAVHRPVRGLEGEQQGGRVAARVAVVGCVRQLERQQDPPGLGDLELVSLLPSEAALTDAAAVDVRDDRVVAGVVERRGALTDERPPAEQTAARWCVLVVTGRRTDPQRRRI